MAQGQTDWEPIPAKVEAVMRPNLMYPSGKLIFYDDFEESRLSWEGNEPPSTFVRLLITNPFRGDGHLELNAPPTGNRTATATKYLGLPPGNIVGVQTAFGARTNNTSLIEMQTVWRDGVRNYKAKVRFTVIAGTIEIWNDTGAYETLSGVTLLMDASSDKYYFMKLIVDFGTGKYIGLHTNQNYTDLSAISVEDTGATLLERLQVSLIGSHTDSNSSAADFDDVAITEEE